MVDMYDIEITPSILESTYHLKANYTLPSTDTNYDQPCPGNELVFTMFNIDSTVADRLPFKMKFQTWNPYQCTSCGSTAPSGGGASSGRRRLGGGSTAASCSASGSPVKVNEATINLKLCNPYRFSFTQTTTNHAVTVGQTSTLELGLPYVLPTCSISTYQLGRV